MNEFLSYLYKERNDVCLYISTSPQIQNQNSLATLRLVWLSSVADFINDQTSSSIDEEMKNDTNVSEFIKEESSNLLKNEECIFIVDYAFKPTNDITEFAFNQEEMIKVDNNCFVLAVEIKNNKKYQICISSGNSATFWYPAIWFNKENDTIIFVMMRYGIREQEEIENVLKDIQKECCMQESGEKAIEKFINQEDKYRGMFKILRFNLNMEILICIIKSK